SLTRATTFSTKRSMRCVVRASSSVSSGPRLTQPLEERGHALTAANAHRLETERLVLELQTVDERASDAGASHAEGMTDGDGAAVHVQLLDVDVELLVRRDDLRGERLVDLDQVDVIDGHLRPGQRLL